jgi:hypothetical protein
MTFGVLLGVNTLFAQEAVKGPQISFEKEVYDFGKLEYNGDGRCQFVFKNTGNEPLWISQVQGSCACAIAEWPKEPILPGKKSKIIIRYDTRRVGPTTKAFTVTSNAVNGPRVLKIIGEVQPPKEDPFDSTPTN